MPADSATDAALRSLTQRSDAKGLAQLAGHAALLAITALAIAASRDTAWFVPAMLAHGVALVFLFAALHESIHRTAFASHRLNDIVAWICGMLLVLPPAYFRSYHMAHHRHTQLPGLDPELATPKPSNLGAYLWYLSGLPYWAERLSTTLRHARGKVTEAFIPEHLQPAVVREARWLLSLYAVIALASVLLQSPAAIWYWVVPALLGQPALRLFLLAEHAGCPQVPEMLRNSRTTLSRWPLRRLAWNMPYHAEHHAHPALPFHALPRAHALLADAIACQATGYLAVHREILKRLSRTRATETVGSPGR
jgi:fatty acid desaturase